MRDAQVLEGVITHEAGNEKLIVLSNWSGKNATVEVTLDGKKRQFTIGAGGIFK